jgi:LPS-assembly protein
MIYSHAFAAEILASASKSEVTLEADNMSAPDNTTFIASGNVVIMKDNATLTADEVTYNTDTGDFDATGNVRLRDGSNFFDCERLLYNFNDEKGTFINVEGFVEPYHYISAEKFERTGEVSYLIERGRFTTCGGDVPDWSFTTKRATMDIGRYIKATHTAGWIKSVPILYTPYFVYPIKVERESGFLLPKFASSSKRGQMAGLKYFRDINIDKDATIGTNIYTSGIVHYMGEFRYAKSRNENIYLYGEYIDDSESESDEERRYLVYQNSNFKIGDNTDVYIEIDYVSDYRYLRDIADLEMVDDYENPDNKFYADLRVVHKTPYADFGFRTKNDMQYTDIDGGYKRTEVYRLPNLFARKNLRAGYLGFNYTADLDHILFKEKQVFPGSKNLNKATDDEYNRLHLTGELYSPINVGIATFKPFAQIMFTKWDGIDEAETVRNSRGNTIAQINSNNDDIERLTYKVGYEINFNEIYKKYANYTHSIYNTFRYEQVPSLDHSAIPERIEGDLIEGTKSYSYLIKNYFNADNWNVTASLQQTYDNMHDEKFRPLIAKFDFNYEDKYNFFIRHDYDYYDTNTALLNQRAGIDLGTFYFSQEYLYEDLKYNEETENTSLEFSVSLEREKFDLAFSTKTSGINNSLSLSNLHTISNSVYATYKSDCWFIGASYTIKEYNPIDNKGSYSGKESVFYVVVGLKGLGSFKTPITTRR